MQQVINSIFSYISIVLNGLSNTPFIFNGSLLQFIAGTSVFVLFIKIIQIIFGNSRKNSATGGKKI